MRAAESRCENEGSRFARELSRATAHRGRLDVVYQTVSDHWTMILQRLFPVWALVGPGLADPGHIELSSRTIYLDSDALLGSREELGSGNLQPRRVLVTFGVAVHEVLHAKCTSVWVMERDIELANSENQTLRQLGIDRKLLEEPRMEANGVHEFPEESKRGRFIRRALGAAVVDVILPRLSEALMIEALTTGSVSRDLCGRTMVYAARTHYGVLNPGRLGPLPAVWEQVLGATDVGELDDLLARLIWVKNGDNDSLDRFAEEYRLIIGPPPADPGRQRQHALVGEKTTDGQDDGPDGNGEARPTPQSLGEALEQAIAEQRESQLEQLNEDIDLQKLLKSATNPEPAKASGRGDGTGRPAGRLPERGVDRPPAADEVQMARQFARRLHQARETGLKRIDKRTPGGNFNPRAHMRAHAQRKMGTPVTAHPWEITRVVTAPLQEPHVAVIVDSSGSMSPFEYALSPVVWVLSEGLREFGGKCAVALFGGAAGLLTDGSQPMRLVPGITTGGGTAFAGDAISMCAEHLEMENQRRPRFVFIISDGGWADTENGVRKIRELRELGVPTVQLAIGCEPLAVEADQVTVIQDPAEAMDIVGRDTVDALRARRRR